jgi:hypothetical protein
MIDCRHFALFLVRAALRLFLRKGGCREDRRTFVGQISGRYRKEHVSEKRIAAQLVTKSLVDWQAALRLPDANFEYNMYAYVCRVP